MLLYATNGEVYDAMEDSDYEVRLLSDNNKLKIVSTRIGKR